MQWTLVVEPAGRPGHQNMGVDYALLRAAQEGNAFLRLYRWSPPCLSFGRHEPARRRYDVELIEQLGLDTVRRPTGGRAVWHDAELTYAVAAPIALFGSLHESYIAIHRMLAAAVRRLGVTVELADRNGGRPPAVSAGACFAAPVGGEVIADGGKLVGSAQVREGGSFLQHGSLLLDDGQDVVGRVTRGSAPPAAAAALSALLGRAVPFEEVADAIRREAHTRWEGRWRNENGTRAPTDRRFADPAWTWRR